MQVLKLSYSYLEMCNQILLYFNSTARKEKSQNSLAAQWLRYHAFTVQGHGFHSWSENWDPACHAAWPKKIVKGKILY